MSLFPNLAQAEVPKQDHLNPTLSTVADNRFKPKTASNNRRSLQFVNSYSNECMN